jgi:hypothetical protein
MGAKRWGDGVTDVILTSGRVYGGEKRIVTASGEYRPVVVDFSERNFAKRLEEIREAADKGSFDDWLELVFLPLYGRETGERRYELVERVIRFEIELVRAERIPARLLVATLIMSNKLIDKDRLKELWEEIKMLDILEIAREKGFEEGRSEGVKDMLMDALKEKFGLVPPYLSEKIGKIDDQAALKSLFKQVFKCSDLEEFEEVFKRL